MKFITGQKYFCRSVCDYNCVWTFEVVSRTSKTITIKGEDGKVSSKRIRVYQGVEQVNPLGTYSMNPILSADKPAKEVA